MSARNRKSAGGTTGALVYSGAYRFQWQNGQYERTRDVDRCREAFEDLLARLQTDYVDLGMIHFVDQENDWETR